MINTDGVQTFNSSKHSIWPVYLCICNLPLHLRMNEKFQIFAGAWYGPKKPSDMATILLPTLNKVSQILQHGIEAHTPAGVKQIKAVLLTGIFDLPGKAAVLNMKQFNGQFGCLYCTDPGEMQMASRIYPPDAPHCSRTEQSIQECASKAEAQQSPVLGIKGYSVLYQAVSIPHGVPIDYMHCVLEGIVKSFLTYWFASNIIVNHTVCVLI